MPRWHAVCGKFPEQTGHFLTLASGRNPTLADQRRLQIAAIADLHYGSPNAAAMPLSELAAGADVLLLCGDLTDRGLATEAQGLVKELGHVNIPVLAVLGNHDYESGHQEDVQRILTEEGIRVLDGTACEINGVGFAGTKGFGGGFGRAMLQPWGEAAVKAYVQEAVNEALKLEGALAQLRTPQRVALLHYAPIAATVAGEPPEIFAFLGCSRLEEPLQRHRVSVAFHGHAHRGSCEGHTATGIPVFNVSAAALKRAFPDQLPVRRFELIVSSPAD
jgi:Icc-related predicted phosphoesterase